MMRKSLKTWMVLFVLLIIVCSSAKVSAATIYKKGSKMRTYAGAYYTIYYAGTEISGQTAPGIRINDNIMISHHLLVAKVSGLKASYKTSTKCLIIKYGTKTLKLYMNKKYMVVNGKRKKLNTAPMTATVEGNSYIMIPIKAVAKYLGLSYQYVKAEKKVYLSAPANTTKVAQTQASNTSNLTAKTLSTMTTAQFIATLGPIAQADYQKTGVLASVTLAQAINESGWGKTTLAQQGNNIFGMKIRLSENTWAGSVWDGKSYVTIYTKEEVKGKKVTVAANFRKYNNVILSIADHSAYLCNALNGSKKRYAGLTATNSYAQQLSILKKGGYCTWSSYVNELTTLIKKYNLTKYDVK